MNKELNRDIRLGIFVLLGILIFVAGIFMIGSKEDMFMKTFRISAQFTNATGLKPGDYVRYNGVRVGVVEAVQLQNDTLVRVDMRIQESKRSFIRKDAIANIASDGLMGDKIINITPGNENLPEVNDNDLIRSSNPLNSDAIMKSLSRTNDNVETIASNLKKLTTDLNESHGALSALIKDTVMSRNIQQSFRNIEQLTSQLSAFGSALQQVMSDVKTGKNSIGAILKDTAMAKNLSASVDQIKTTSDKLINVSDQLSLTASRMNSGNGTVNKLLTDSALAANLDSSVVNFKKATVTLNEDLEALQHTALLKGYFKKQEEQKAEEQKKKK